MLPRPSLKLLPRMPVTGGVGILAIVVSVSWWLTTDIGGLLEGPEVPREPWRLLTSILPHVNVIHLAFNLYWLWIFGVLVERTYGHARMLGLVVLLAAASSAAEYALMQGGVGLSGVVYGLFGMLWVLSIRHAKFCGAIDGVTASLFGGWFVICIVSTYANFAPVANVAHAVGAAVGAMVGAAVQAQGRMRQMWTGGVAVVAIACVAGAMAFRPVVSLLPMMASMDPNAAEAVAYEGYLALERGDTAGAIRLYEAAVTSPRVEAGWWVNLGIARERSGQEDRALEAYQKAGALEFGKAEFARGAAEFLARRAYGAYEKKNIGEAIRLLEEAVADAGATAACWFMLGEMYELAERRAEAVRAYDKAVERDPGNESYKAAAKRVK